MTGPVRLTPVAKPRIALMGEFSAGKSTLCNLLLRARPLPEKVTATRLPPVWLAKGPGDDFRELLDGSTEPVRAADLNDIPFEETRLVKLHFDADILTQCDLIDFPGISDPNMDSEVWERVLTEADAVIWLTHATQAWRQSEAAVWDNVPDEVREKSVLLVTRFDKLTNDVDRGRVLARLKKETFGLFDKIFPISLTQAIEGFEDEDLWHSSGAAAFTDHLLVMMNTLGQHRAAGNSAKVEATPQSGKAQERLQPTPLKSPVRTVPESGAVKVIPRRVKPGLSGARAARPVGRVG